MEEISDFQPLRMCIGVMAFSTGHSASKVMASSSDLLKRKSKSHGCIPFFLTNTLGNDACKNDDFPMATPLTICN